MRYPVVAPQNLVEMFYLIDQLKVCHLSENYSQVDHMVIRVLGDFMKDPLAWYEDVQCRKSIDLVALYNPVKKKQLLELFQLIGSVNATVEWLHRLQPKGGMGKVFNEYIKDCVDYLGHNSIRCTPASIGGELWVVKGNAIMAFCLGFTADKPYTFTMRIYGQREAVEC